jgi:putative transposase
MSEKWMSAAEIDALHLPQMPAGKNGVIRLAKREGWPSRPRQGRGGGLEYPLSALPQAARDALALSRAVTVAPGAVLIQQELPLPAPADLRNWQRDTLTARAIVLAHVQNMAHDCGSILKAEALFAEAAAKGTLPPTLQQAVRTANARAGASRSLSTQTLRRWRTEARKSPDAPTVLAPKHNPIAEAPAWLEPVLDVYAHPIHRSVSEVLEIVAQRNPSLELPSVRTVQRVIASLGPLARNAGRLSARELKRFRAFVKRNFDDLEPLDVISADGHSFKAEVVNFLSGKPCKPEIVTVIDIATRRVIGYSLGLFEKAWLVADALRHAARLGVAAIFYTDNGCGFVNDHLGNEAFGVLARLGSTHRTAIAYNAQARGVIERLQSSLWHRAARALPTYSGARASKDFKQAVYKRTRRDLAEQGHSKLLLDWPDFTAHCEASIAAYNDRPHSSLPKILCPLTGTRRHQTPNEAWAAFIAKGWQPIIPDAALLDDLFRPTETRTVNRARVQIGGHTYYSKVLEDLDLHEASVRVAYDIHDASRVWISDAEGRRICIAERDANSARYFPEAETAAAKETRRQANAQLQRLQKQEEKVLAQLGGLRVVEGGDGATVEVVPVTPVTPARASRRAQIAAEIQTPAPVVQLETPNERFARARALEAALSAGETVQPEQAAWLTRYQQLPEYRARKNVEEGFQRTA